MTFTLPSAIDPNSAPLRNQEPVFGTYSDRIAEKLHITAGTALDFSSASFTAVPAGSRGRIQIHATDPTKLAEAELPDVAVRFMVAQWAPDRAQAFLPSSKEAITAGVEHLARCGYNAIRVHGIEFWLMSGSTQDYEFPPQQLDLFWWFLAECKRLGVFWVINPRQPQLYQGGPSRFAMPTWTKNYKERIFVQQDARDNWHIGFDRLYNQVNPYTGINMLQDPALFQVECINECAAQFMAYNAWPSTWMVRDSERGTGAMTFPEWLATPTMAHGYSNIAALNASWGTSYTNFGEILAPSGGDLPTLTMAETQESIDIIFYLCYLDDSLSDFFEAEMAAFACPALYVSTISFQNSIWMRAVARNSGNQLANVHNYPFLAEAPANGAVIYGGDGNVPVWEAGTWLYTSCTYTSGKPAYPGEYGWTYWGIYRNQYAALGAVAALQGGSAVSSFHQGNFFSPSYTSGQNSRTLALYPYDQHSDPAAAFTAAAMHFAFVRQYVTEATATKTLTVSDRYYGINPRNPTRVTRAFGNMFLPVSLYGGITKTRLNWTSDTSDDSLATELNVPWNTFCANALAGTGFSAPAIAADNLTYLSSLVNNGTITAVATSGIVGTVTASLTQPVLTLSGANTLVNGDKIAVLTMSGTPGTWPGTSKRGTAVPILQTGVANRVQITSGLDLTAGLSGANFTAGTWCEFANEMESGTGEIFVSRRRKFLAIDTPKLQLLCVGIGATIPTLANVTVTAIPDLGGVFLASLDDATLSTSQHILVGIVGNPRNTGDVLSGDGVTLVTAGTQPIQFQDITVSLSLSLVSPRGWSLYRLAADGTRTSKETPTSINAATDRLNLTLRTGSIQPTVFFELVR
jgi:hypothetical protein